MRRLREDLWLLELGWHEPFGSNAYLIDDAIDPETGERTAGELTLVDTGYRWNRRSLASEIAAAGYDTGEIDRIVLTHYDLDHTGGLHSIPVDCPVYLGATEIELAEGEYQPPLSHHKGLFHRATRTLFPLPKSIDLHSVTDEQWIGRFEAFATPGHNPGHMVYVHESGVAFLGDLVWETDGELTTPFWGDSYDMRQVRESVKSLAQRCPPFEVACMGHGSPFTENGFDYLQRLAGRL
ncbi:MBL fold metallo-hydrolase [Halocatena halophila]|uniref:MBL fold metallo-hydrolase n=1 Tax=Halocatena halophila TaxID=2814576 RepID=UPI002ED61720